MTKGKGTREEPIDDSESMGWWNRFRLWLILKLLGGEMLIANAEIGMLYMHPAKEGDSCFIVNSSLSLVALEDPEIVMTTGDDGK